MTVPNKVTIHKQIGGMGTGEGGCLVIPDIIHEGEPEPVDD